MPIYEYDCLNCGKMFEELVNSSSEKIKCTECGSTKVERKISIFGFTSNSRSLTSSSGNSCGTCKSHRCSTCH